MKYQIAYAFQRKPGSIAEFASAIVKIDYIGMRESDLNEFVSYIKKEYGYSSVVVISFNLLIGDEENFAYLSYSPYSEQKTLEEN